MNIGNPTGGERGSAHSGESAAGGAQAGDTVLLQEAWPSAFLSLSLNSLPPFIWMAVTLQNRQGKAGHPGHIGT